MQGFPQNAGELPIEVRQAAGRLWRLFPLVAHGRSAHAQILIESATCDIAQLERFNSENRGCNWGLATGPSSGVFAVDADDQNNAAAFVAYSMKYEGGESWQETLESVAGDRKASAFFLWPEGLVFSATRRTIAQGLRIRGEGDFVPIPPSVNRAGVPYLYHDPEASVAPPPKWLVKWCFEEPNGHGSPRVLRFPEPALQPKSTAAGGAGTSGGIILPFSSFVGVSPRPVGRRRVHMLVQFRDCWRCQFLDEDLRAILPRPLMFKSPEKVAVLAEKGGGLKRLGGREALRRVIEQGPGSVLLELTEEQYSRLNAACRPRSPGFTSCILGEPRCPGKNNWGRHGAPATRHPQLQMRVMIEGQEGKYAFHEFTSGCVQAEWSRCDSWQELPLGHRMGTSAQNAAIPRRPDGSARRVKIH
jgi:hypothetical protein